MPSHHGTLSTVTPHRLQFSGIGGRFQFRGEDKGLFDNQALYGSEGVEIGREHEGIILEV